MGLREEYDMQISPQRASNEAWEAAEVVFEHFMETIGYAPDTSPHLANTPRRYIGMLKELFHDEPWEFTTFENETGVPGQAGDSGIVVVRDITFTSLCAHHFAPFFGKAHVAYIPGAKLPGLSKIARTVRSYSRGPQIQEDITKNVADFLSAQLEPLGILVVLDAEHTCMTHRGVKAHGTSTVTSALRGVFFDDARARAEAYRLLEFGR